MKFTRRELAAVLAPAVTVSAQTDVPADELKAAQARFKAAADAMARQPLPMDAEPAFQFKA